MTFSADTILNPHELLNTVFDPSRTLELHLSSLTVFGITASVLLTCGTVLRPVILHRTTAVDDEMDRGTVSPSVLTPVSRLKVMKTGAAL